jgi:DNA-binding response OmpR family regulator
MGADDYVTKPFGMAELIARVRVALRPGERARGAALRVMVAGACVGGCDIEVLAVTPLAVEPALRRALGGQAGGSHVPGG